MKGSEVLVPVAPGVLRVGGSVPGLLREAPAAPPSVELRAAPEGCLSDQQEA